MSYSAYDANGYIGEAANISGWYRFAEWLRSQGGEMEVLAEKGFSENLPKLIEELKAAKPKTKLDKLLRLNFIELASKADLLLIVSDGT